VSSHVCTAALPEHCVAPGAQDPVHWPPEQAALPHATGFPHAPVLLQVSTPLLLHCVDPGEHDPVHAPPTHAVFTHVEAGPQEPVVLHVDTPLTEPPSDPVAHSVAPGVQTPWHEAVPTGPAHAWFVHEAAVPQVPVAVHVWKAELPEHWVCPGAQTPPQDAVVPDARHVVFEQVEGGPHVPDVVHIETPLSELPLPSVAHAVVPGAQTPWHEPVLPLVTHA